MLKIIPDFELKCIFSREFFSELGILKFSTSFHCKAFLASKAIFENVFGEQELYIRVLPNFCFELSLTYGNSSIPKTLKVILLLNF